MLYVPPYSPDLFEVLTHALEEATRRGHGEVSPEHYLLGLLEAERLGQMMPLEELAIDAGVVRRDLERLIDPPGQWTFETYRPTRDARRVMDRAWRLAGEMASGFVCAEHLMLALMLDELSPAGHCLGRHVEDFEAVRLKTYWHIRENHRGRGQRIWRMICRFVGVT